MFGLGGFDFETIFGASELAVPFQCSRVCDAHGGPIDTMTCDGPYACNRVVHHAVVVPRHRSQRLR